MLAVGIAGQCLQLRIFMLSLLLLKKLAAATETT